MSSTPKKATKRARKQLQPATHGTPSASSKKSPLQLNLALQGGGAHGAFTWGVLDRLLEEEDIEIHGISGTSAGAMNGAVLIDGFIEGGRARAKEQLADFWFEISQLGAAFSAASGQPFKQFLPHGLGLDWLVGFNPVDLLSRTFSPYDLNPLNLNPLRDVLERVLHVENLHAPAHLFVTATNVETGQPRVFKCSEITIDVLLASACLPFVFQAVEIDGVPYWDGGYVGNPAIWPLIYYTECRDNLLVQINPIQRKGTPRSSFDIINRLNEISFNSSLIAEMRAINFVRKLIMSGKITDKHYQLVHMHMVSPPENLHGMDASSKMNADWMFIQMLRDAGREAIEQWLREHKSSIGKRSTLDIEQNFLVKPASAMSAPR